MNLTTKITLLCAAIAAACAWWLRGTVAVGILAGFLAGACMAGLAFALQQRLARQRPQWVVQAAFASFLFKAFVLLGTAFLLRFVEPLGRGVDRTAYILSFAAAVLAILAPATLETLRALDTKKLDPARLERNKGAGAILPGRLKKGEAP